MIYDVMIGICFLLGMTMAFLVMCREKGLRRFRDIAQYVGSNQTEMTIWAFSAVAGLILLRYGGFEYFGWNIDVINPGTALGAGIGVALWVRTRHKKREDKS